MMSAQGVDLVRQAHDAVNDHDFERFVSLLAPDVEAVPLVSELAGTSYRGHEGIRDWWDHVFAVFPHAEVEFEQLRDLGEHVIAEMRFRGGGSEGDGNSDLTIWVVYEIRDAKIAGWRSYRSEDEALAASA
jgi:ketosteroid isomerase-like protein